MNLQHQNSPAELPDSLRLFSVRQVAQLLQVRESAVRKLIFEGKLTATRVGVLIRISQSSLERFLDENPCTEPDARRDPRRRRSSLPRVRQQECADEPASS